MIYLTLPELLHAAMRALGREPAVMEIAAGKLDPVDDIAIMATATGPRSMP